MKIFEAIQKNLKEIGFGANLSPLNKYHIQRVLISISAFASQFIYILHDVNSVQEYMYSFFTLIVGIAIFISYFSMIFKNTELYGLINKIQKISTERSQNPASKVKFYETNELVEKLSKIIHFIVVKVSVPGFVLPKAIFCIFIYYSTDLGTDVFELPILMWFPFDWRNPIGYSITVALQIYIASIPFRYLTCFTSFALGSYLIAITFANDVLDDIKTTNDNLKTLKSKIDISKKFSELINLHSDAKELIGGFSKIYETTLTVLFAGSSITICVAMLLIQMEISSFQSHDKIDFVLMSESIFLGFLALLLVFFASEIGQRFSNAFREIDNMIGQMNWYLLPIELQKIWPIMLINGKKRIAIQFFGSCSCSRKQFKKVVNTIYSYFMTLRKFY